MTVDQIIHMMAQTSVGIDLPTQPTKEMYLTFLNAYHFELYNKVAELNPLQSEEIDTFVKPHFFMKNVNVLHKVNMQHIFLWPEYYKIVNVTFKGRPVKYRLFKEYIKPLYPAQYLSDAIIQVEVIKLPKLLEIDHPEDAIPYPKSFHHLLVYGANYHMYQNEGGLKSQSGIRINEAKKGEMEKVLVHYLLSINPDNNADEFITYKPM